LRRRRPTPGYEDRDEPNADGILSLEARRVLTLLARRWTLPILNALRAGHSRPSRLTRIIGGVTEKVLVETLRALEEERLIDRSVYPEVPLRVEYQLTDKAMRLCDALVALDDWAERESILSRDPSAAAESRA